MDMRKLRMARTPEGGGGKGGRGEREWHQTTPALCGDTTDQKFLLQQLATSLEKKKGCAGWFLGCILLATERPCGSGKMTAGRRGRGEGRGEKVERERERERERDRESPGKMTEGKRERDGQGRADGETEDSWSLWHESQEEIPYGRWVIDIPIHPQAKASRGEAEPEDPPPVPTPSALVRHPARIAPGKVVAAYVAEIQHLVPVVEDVYTLKALADASEIGTHIREGVAAYLPQAPVDLPAVPTPLVVVGHERDRPQRSRRRTAKRRRLRVPHEHVKFRHGAALLPVPV